jgi:hypothetical protein
LKYIFMHIYHTFFVQVLARICIHTYFHIYTYFVVAVGACSERIYFF